MKKNHHLFPALQAFWYLKKTALCENRINGTVLMIQLMLNSPTCTYIGQNLLMWKPRYAGTRCTEGSRLMPLLGLGKSRISQIDRSNEMNST